MLLVNADVLSRKVSPRDRNSYPLIGDAASIAILERREDAAATEASIKFDGGGREALMIPAGGMRHPSDASTAEMTEDAEGNFRSLDNLRMDGSAVFNFVMTQVPELIGGLLADTGTAIADVDAFLCHQPNRFMLGKLADKLGVPHEKMPSNIVEKFGNSSSVTIPLATAYNLCERLAAERLRVCLAGLRVHRLRLVLTTVAVMLGVAFISGTFVLTDTMQAGIDKKFTASASNSETSTSRISRGRPESSRANRSRSLTREAMRLDSAWIRPMAWVIGPSSTAVRLLSSA